MVTSLGKGRRSRKNHTLFFLLQTPHAGRKEEEMTNAHVEAGQPFGHLGLGFPGCKSSELKFRGPTSPDHRLTAT